VTLAVRSLTLLENALSWAGSLALILVAVLLNGDILGRLLFGWPVQIQFEMTEIYLMPALAVLPMSRVFREGGHLALEVIPEDAFGGATVAIRRAILLAAAAFFAVVTWKAGAFAAHAFARNDVEWGVVDWPLGWAYSVIPLGCGVLVLRLIVEAIGSAKKDSQSWSGSTTGGD